MGKPVEKLQVEYATLQVAQLPHRTVIQAIESEAERILLQSGGMVRRNGEGYLYEEYLDSGFPPLVIYWPAQTRFVYVAPCEQEDRFVIFLVAILPGLQAELHLTYDYRPWNPLHGPFEEFFTLRVAQVHIFIEREAGDESQSS
ncbi:hypothetical protein KSF_085630 [Reticulibacter mediterranei]|uniref:Uncharacterized protein n=1 Tax=Reticulibacter mediterranei TaxID=2778369 RepID=A0A8J3N7I5_9CHLR|nr:hypothetical protein [Reticulibacter mediterranei]GHO98515.1 hypothetical protein KSF_085630 [Reticulibacter mediterranei]